MWLIGLAYSLVIAWIYGQWKRTTNCQPPTTYIPSTGVTVLIPARNEAANLSDCLESVFSQQYPADLLEVWVIDDFSTDNTAAIASSFPHCHVAQMSDYFSPIQVYSPKKQALDLGISLSANELIVTTDADCIHDTRWLRTLVYAFEQGSVQAIAAPVLFRDASDTIGIFQGLDYVGMMAVTAAGIRSGCFHLCNGANFAYARRVYEEIEGFAGIDHIASGDDMLLLQKIVAEYPSSVRFVPDVSALAYSLPKQSIHAFWQQRLRWAGKSAFFKGTGIWIVQGIVWLTCMAIISCALWGLITVDSSLLGVAGLLSAIKTLVDFLYLKSLCQHFGQGKWMRYFLISQVMHVVYISAVGMSSFFIKKTKWKGRMLS